MSIPGIGKSAPPIDDKDEKHEIWRVRLVEHMEYAIDTPTPLYIDGTLPTVVETLQTKYPHLLKYVERLEQHWANEAGRITLKTRSLR